MKTKNYWTLGLSLCAVVVVSMNAAFVYLATTNKSTLVSEEYYEDGVQYQKVIDSEKSYDTYFPDTDVEYVDKKVILQIDSRKISKATLVLTRADDQRLDKELTMASLDSLLTTPKVELKKGSWSAQLNFVINQTAFSKKFKLWIN
jgi:hypothetical protein